MIKYFRCGSFITSYWIALPLFLYIFVALFPPYAYSYNLVVPNYWDSKERGIRDTKDLNPPIRFVVSASFPPFSFIDEKNAIRGFHADLAQAVCEELKLGASCLIQALPWQEQEATLKKGENTALLSGMAISPASRRRLLFTRPYLTIPARFVALQDSGLAEPLYRGLRGKVVGVISNTAHEAYLKQNFGGAQIRLFLDDKSLFAALQKRQIDVVFSDALSASNWLHANSAANCCRYVGGPYISQKFFGQGFAIAVGRDNKVLLNALNQALQAINDNGKFAEIYLRYFPVGLF